MPGAELHVAPVHELPFVDGSFDVAVLNDVLQHVAEAQVDAGLRELRRVLRPDGVLLVRTNGGRRARRERADWRLYDADLLRGELEAAGFDVVRVTYVNTALSLWGAARGRTPTAPTPTTCGIPAQAGSAANVVGRTLLGLEARILRHSTLSLPYGHTLACPGGAGVSVPEFFDTTVERYDRRYDESNAAGRLLRRRLEVAVELLGEPRGSVLDVGMGTGRLCAELDRSGWDVSGVDLSPAMVGAARRRLPQLAERLVEGPIEHLPFDDGSFDAVTATGVLEYATHDLDAAVAELARVLRLEGVAVLSFPRQQSPALLWRSKLLYPAVRAAKRIAPFGRPAPLDLPPRSEQEFLAAVAGAGLSVEETRRIGRFASHLVLRARKT